MGTNCAPLVVDLFLFCYERYFMTSLSNVKLAETIEAFKSKTRYLDDLLNIDNPYFEGMVNLIYPPELQLNKANTSDTEAQFLDLHFSISNGLDRNVLRPSPGDPWGVEQHHWNTGAKENQQLNPGGPSNRQKSSGPNQLK